MKELQFIVRNGLVETKLTHSPDGWEGLSLEIERSNKFLGMVRSYSLALKFVLDGADLLRAIFYNRLQNDVFLIVKKLNPITLVYEQIYTGLFDFSTFVDTNYYVNVSVLDNGLSNVIKKNMDVSYLILFGYGSFTPFYIMGEYGPIQPMKGILFSTFLSYHFNRVTEGRYLSDEFGLEMSALTYKEGLIDTVLLTNAMGLINATRFDRIEISFSSLIKTIFTLFNLVMSVEIISGKETLKLRNADDAYPALPFSEIKNLGDLKITVAKDFIYDTIKTGAPDIDLGTDEFTHLELGTESVFSNPSAFVGSQELDTLLPFRTDTIGIKQYISMYGTTPEDADYTTFLVHVEKNIVYNNYVMELGYVGEDNPPADKVAYNVAISPKRLYRLHERYVNSCFFGNNTQTNLVSGRLNIPALYSQDGYRSYPAEFEGSGVVRSAVPYFIPLYIEFDGLLPDDILISDMYNPENSKLSFTYKGSLFAGIMIGMKVNLYGKQKVHVKLLCASENDLTKLIEETITPPVWRSRLTINKTVNNDQTNLTNFQVKIWRFGDNTPMIYAINQTTPIVIEEIEYGDFTIEEIPFDGFVLSSITPSSFTIGNSNLDQIVEIINTRLY
jgi:hypothetical protein